MPLVPWLTNFDATMTRPCGACGRYVDSARHILVYGQDRDGPSSLRVVFLEDLAADMFGGLSVRRKTRLNSYDIIGGTWPACHVVHHSHSRMSPCRRVQPCATSCKLMQLCAALCSRGQRVHPRAALAQPRFPACWCWL